MLAHKATTKASGAEVRRAEELLDARDSLRGVHDRRSLGGVTETTLRRREIVEKAVSWPRARSLSLGAMKVHQAAVRSGNAAIVGEHRGTNAGTDR